MADKGIMVIEHADFDGIERLAASTGAEILSTFDNPERKDVVLGHCDLIEEIMIGEDKVIHLQGTKESTPPSFPFINLLRSGLHHRDQRSFQAHPGRG